MEVPPIKEWPENLEIRGVPARERWGWGRVQEDGRVIGVRNNDGRAEDAAEIDVGRTFVRKKAQGWLPRPLMAGAGLGSKSWRWG